MTKYTALKEEVQNDPTYYMLTDAQWETKIQLRALPIKFKDQLLYLLDFYPQKISRLLEILHEIEDPDDRVAMQLKLKRLKDKFACTLKEVEWRNQEKVKRTPHGTTYYIDYVNGSDSNDGLSTGAAWKTLSKYTTVTARTPGDIAKVRANQTHTYNTADIVFDEDGNADNYITIKGCDSTDDPWSDGSDVKPVISFGSASYQMYLSGDNYWKLHQLNLTGSTDSYGAVRVNDSKRIVIDSCVIQGNGSTGAYDRSVSSVHLINTEFYDNGNYGVVNYDGIMFIEGCEFNSGNSGTSYGIYSAYGITDVKDTTFGSTTTHSESDLRVGSGGIIRLRNCILSSTTEQKRTGYGGGVIHSEDHDQIFGAHKSWYYTGSVTKDTTVVRSGGGSSSAKLEPSSNASSKEPLTIADDWLHGDFKIWCSAAQTTVTIYIRGFGWSSFPTSSELYVEASYLSNAATADRSTTKSTAVLTDNTTWVGFSVTFTPAREGWAYLTVNLTKYTASCGVYVDVEPVIS